MTWIEGREADANSAKPAAKQPLFSLLLVQQNVTNVITKQVSSCKLKTHMKCSFNPIIFPCFQPVSKGVFPPDSLMEY